MSQYFEDYNPKNDYDNNDEFADDSNELKQIKKYQKLDSDEDTESDTQIYKFSNKYSIGGIACVLIIIVIVLLYIYFNHYKQ